jgi:hypothetical protein
MTAKMFFFTGVCLLSKRGVLHIFFKRRYSLRLVLGAGVPYKILQEINMTPRMSKIVLVIRREHGPDIVKTAVRKLLRDDSIFIDGRSTRRMAAQDLARVVRTAKKLGRPVFLEQKATASYLKSLDSRGYWLYDQVTAQEFDFWEITGGEENPKRIRIAV